MGKISPTNLQNHVKILTVYSYYLQHHLQPYQKNQKKMHIQHPFCPYLNEYCPFWLNHLRDLLLTEVIIRFTPCGNISMKITNLKEVTRKWDFLLTVADSTLTIPCRFNWTLTLTLAFSPWELWKGPICYTQTKKVDKAEIFLMQT